MKGQVVAPEFEAAFPGHANALGGSSDVYVKGAGSPSAFR
jgi:hypothetical protein